MVEEHDAVAFASMVSDTTCLLDLWGPEFGTLDEKWLSEDLPQNLRGPTQLSLTPIWNRQGRLLVL